MPEVNLRLNAHLVQMLTEIIRIVLDSIQDPPAARRMAWEDEELRESWEEGLVEGLREDSHALLALFADAKFGKGGVKLSPEQADAVLRASSATRLRIHQTLLRGVPDGELEAGQVELVSLQPQQQKAYLCYLFLASLQDLLLREVDPELEKLD